MKNTIKFTLCIASIIFFSWLAWWWSLDLEIVNTEKVGDLWIYWSEFNKAFSMASGIGLVVVLIAEMLSSDKKEGK